MKEKTYMTLGRFSLAVSLILVYGILVTIYAVMGFAGVQMPFDAQLFEGSTITKGLLLINGIASIAGFFVGSKALKEKDSLSLKVCAILGTVIVILFCAVMFISNGHVNPHMWILFGAACIPGANFAGYAIRLTTLGWDA